MALMISLPSLLPARAVVCRDCLKTLLPVGGFQKRWIGTKYLEKMRLAENDWMEKAAEIKAGTKKNLFDEFEDRGLIKDVVG